MVALPESARALLRSGALAHCTTLDADGGPQVSAVWVGLAADDPDVVVMAHVPRNRKVRNLQRDPRIALSLQAEERNAIGMQEYLTIRGRAEVTEGGAPELLQELVKVYSGPDAVFPLPADAPGGYVVRVHAERIGGNGPWAS
jgi:PPOX class probable F420-dependent enzyme